MLSNQAICVNNTILWNFKYPTADNTQTLSRKGHSNCYSNEMLTHTIRDIERRCADYTFSLGIICTQAMNEKHGTENLGHKRLSVLTRVKSQES